MIISPNLITAIAKPLSGSKLGEGAGRVERQVDSSTYVISLGTGKMTVRVTDGSLAAGQRVNVTARNDVLVIERLSAALAQGLRGSDAYQQTAAASPRDLRSAIDAIVAELSAPGAGPDAFRRSQALLQTISADLSAIDPKLTEAIKQALGSAAAAAPDSPPPAESGRAAIELLQRIRNAVTDTEAAAMPGKTVTVARPLPEGLYAFSSVEEALRFLGAGAAADRSLAAELERALAEDGVIVLRTAALSPAETAATLLRQGDLLRELESLVSRFASRAFQSIPPEVFERLLLDRGSLSFDLLRLLDSFAAGLQLPAASARAGSREARAAALAQWLHAAFDSRTVSGSLASLLPAFSASSIIDAFEELSASAAAVPGLPAKLPRPEGFGLTLQTLGGTADRALLFNLRFQRLGLDFENTLATTGTVDKSGLKPLLLNISAMLAGGGPAAPGTGPAAPESGAAEGQLRAALAAFEHTAATALEKSLAAVLSRPESIGREAQAAIANARAEIAGLLKSGTDGLSRLIEGLLAELRTAARNAALPEGGRGAETLNALVNDARNRIESLVRQMTADLEKGLRGLVQRLAEQAPALSREAAPVLARLLSGLQAPLDKPLADALLQKIDDFRSAFPRLAETVLRQAAAEAARRGGEAAAAGQQEPQAARAGADENLALRAALRQNLDTLVNRFESLQLLARQVPTAAGDQQIVALPIKVGEEWTEMHVRFVRRRSRGGSGRQGHYSVYLNVAPSLLGGISCRLDYVQKKSLSVSVEFESRETREWFQEHKNEVRKALLALGLPSPQLEFLLERRPAADKAGGSTGRAAASSTIDLKV